MIARAESGKRKTEFVSSLIICSFRELKNNYYILFLLCALPACNTLHGQQHEIDSLRSLIVKDKEDTNKVIHICLLCNAYDVNGEFEKSLNSGNQSLELAAKLDYKRGIAAAYNELGNLYLNQSDCPQALEYFLRALKIDESLQDKTGMMKRLGNIGVVYKIMADYPKAMDYYFRSLKIAEELAKSPDKALAQSSKNRVAIQLGNIGNIYNLQGEYTKALDFYFKALKQLEAVGDKVGIARIYGNIGAAYSDQSYRLEASPLRDSLLNNALQYCFKSLKLNQESGRKLGVAIELGSIGLIYQDMKDYAEAEKYLFQAIEMSSTLGALNYERQYEELISTMFEETERFNLALEHYKKAMVLKDSLFNEEKNKELVQKEMSYEFEKKEAATKAEQDKKDTVTTIVIYSVSAGLILVLILTGFIFRGYKQKQKANKIISEQKLLVEEKQKDILDSIQYAKRIQDSLLPTEKYIDKALNRLKNKIKGS